MPQFSFNRSYTLFIGSRPDLETIVAGVEVTQLHIEFDVSIEEKDNGKTGEITVYNLSENSIALLSAANAYVELAAGYAGEETIILSGEVTYADTYTSGADLITEIKVQDGFKELSSVLHPDIKEGNTGYTYAPGTLLIDVITSVFSKLGYAKGSVDLGGYEGTGITSGYSISGSTHKVIDQLLLRRGLYWWVESGAFNIIPRDKKKDDKGSVWNISSETGMIGSPRITRDKTSSQSEEDDKPTIGLTVNTLLNPNIKLADKVTVASRFLTSIVSQDYRVKGISHKGSYEGSNWVTELTLTTYTEEKATPVVEKKTAEEVAADKKKDKLQHVSRIFLG